MTGFFGNIKPHGPGPTGPTIAAARSQQGQVAVPMDPQFSPWVREKNETALAAALATFSAAELGSIIAASLVQRFGAHEAANILNRADRTVRMRP